LYPAAACPG